MDTSSHSVVRAMTFEDDTELLHIVIDMIQTYKWSGKNFCHTSSASSSLEEERKRSYTKIERSYI